MREFLRWLLAYRAEAPGDDDERRLLAIRVAMVLSAMGAGISLLIIPVASATHVRDYHPLGIAVPAALAVLVVPAMYAFRERLSWDQLFTYFIATIALISVGQYSAGGRLPLGAILYVWAAIFAFLFFPRPRAIVVTVAVGAEYAAVLAFGHGFTAPVVQWMFLVASLLVIAVVLDWLIRRIRALGDAEARARQQLQQAHDELAQWNRSLEARVNDQLSELQALGELRRFLSPQVADAVVRSVSSGNVAMLEPHRRQISVLFCDLRGFTAFASAAEPEEVLEILDEYYQAVGEAVHKFEATVGAISGDGLMAYFNDPIPCLQPARTAVEMALELRRRISRLSERWALLGHDLGVGIGIAFGYASLGVVGLEDRRDYTPLGTVVNLASRLCDEAIDGQILVDRHVFLATSDDLELARVGEVLLKGFPRLVPVYAVLPDPGLSRGSQQPADASIPDDASHC